MAKEPEEKTEAEEQEPEITDWAHAEMLAAYKDASDNMRFSKTFQWRITAYAIAAIAILVALGLNLQGDEKLKIFLLIGLAIVSASSMLILAMLQVWQVGEQKRIAFLSQRFSHQFRSAQQARSPLVRDIHRYTFLYMMILFIVLATIIALRILW